MKLLKTERSVKYYNNSDKHVAGEFNIDEIPVETLFTIVIPETDDPLLYDGRVLSREQFEKINDILAEKITPDFNLYYYVLECSGIYDWDMKP
jgi:hypothetical protein